MEEKKEINKNHSKKIIILAVLILLLLSIALCVSIKFMQPAEKIIEHPSLDSSKNINYIEWDSSPNQIQKSTNQNSEQITAPSPKITPATQIPTYTTTQQPSSTFSSFPSSTHSSHISTPGEPQSAPSATPSTQTTSQQPAISFDRSSYSSIDEVLITVTDSASNQNSAQPDEITITLASEDSSTPTGSFLKITGQVAKDINSGITIKLVETGSNTGEFKIKLPIDEIATRCPKHDDKIICLLVKPNKKIKAMFQNQIAEASIQPYAYTINLDIDKKEAFYDEQIEINVDDFGKKINIEDMSKTEFAIFDSRGKQIAQKEIFEEENPQGDRSKLLQNKFKAKIKFKKDCKEEANCIQVSNPQELRIEYKDSKGELKQTTITLKEPPQCSQEPSEPACLSGENLYAVKGSNGCIKKYVCASAAQCPSVQKQSFQCPQEQSLVPAREIITRCIKAYVCAPKPEDCGYKCKIISNFVVSATSGVNNYGDRILVSHAQDKLVLKGDGEKIKIYTLSHDFPQYTPLKTQLWNVEEKILSQQPLTIDNPFDQISTPLWGMLWRDTIVELVPEQECPKPSMQIPNREENELSCLCSASDSNPVCDENNVMYPNKCVAQCNGVTATREKCQPTTRQTSMTQQLGNIELSYMWDPAVYGANIPITNSAIEQVKFSLEYTIFDDLQNQIIIKRISPLLTLDAGQTINYKFIDVPNRIFLQGYRKVRVEIESIDQQNKVIGKKTGIFNLNDNGRLTDSAPVQSNSLNVPTVQCENCRTKSDVLSTFSNRF